MSDEMTLDEFGGVEAESNQQVDKDFDTLEQEQFGPFRLSTPGEWTAKRLGDIKQLITRGKQPTYADDGVPVINQECIYWDGWHFENLRYLDKDVAEEWSEKYFPQLGDVILNSTGQGTLGRAQVYPDSNRRAIDSHVTLLRTDNQLSPYFHRYFLESHLGQALLYSMCVNGSTGQIELSKTRLDLLPIPLPPLKEQHKVATVLYTVDQAIQKTKEIIAQRERVKTGLLQDLFERGIDTNGNLRPSPSEDPSLFEEKHDRIVPSVWQVERLAEIGEWVSGKTPKRSEPSYWGGTIPWITAKDMKTLYVGESEDSITETAVEEGATVVPSESVLVLVRGMILDHTLPVVRPTRDTSINQDVKAIHPHDSVDPDYLAYWLKAHSNEVLALVTSASHGTKRLATEAFGNLVIPVPPLEEQIAIVEHLHSIDDLVEKEKSYIDSLKRVKKGLMQDLLTGEVRTTDADIEIPEEVTAYG